MLDEYDNVQQQLEVEVSAHLACQQVAHWHKRFDKDKKTCKGTICKHNKNKNKEITKTGNQQKRRKINIKVSSWQIAI